MSVNSPSGPAAGVRTGDLRCRPVGQRVPRDVVGSLPRRSKTVSADGVTSNVSAPLPPRTSTFSVLAANATSPAPADAVERARRRDVVLTGGARRVVDDERIVAARAGQAGGGDDRSARRVDGERVDVGRPVHVDLGQRAVGDRRRAVLRDDVAAGLLDAEGVGRAVAGRGQRVDRDPARIALEAPGARLLVDARAQVRAQAAEGSCHLVVDDRRVGGAPPVELRVDGRRAGCSGSRRRRCSTARCPSRRRTTPPMLRVDPQRPVATGRRSQ